MQLFHFASCSSLSMLSKLLETFLKTVGLDELMGLLICNASQFDIHMAHHSGNDSCHLYQVWLLLAGELESGGGFSAESKHLEVWKFFWIFQKIWKC
jgi:hypothetical protein